MAGHKLTSEPDTLFTALVVLSGLFILFTSVHMAVYNWGFLPRYAQAKELPMFLTLDILASYWRWWPGRILVLLSIGWPVGLVLMFMWLKRSVEQHARREE